MSIHLKESDLPADLMDDERISVRTDKEGNVTELTYSSAPDLNMPSLSYTLTFDGDSVRFDKVTHVLFPDPGEDPDFYDEEDGNKSIETPGHGVHIARFHSWAMEHLDLVQYNTEIWRNDLKMCSFCQKHQGQVEHVVAGPDDLAICNECVDLCEDVLAEEGA